MKKVRSFIRKNIWTLVLLFTVIILQIPLITPLLRSGYFPNHDDVQVVRVFEIFQSIQYGDFPPRWSAGLLYGHGYPVFVFYAPLSYLIAACFVLFGFTFLTATKLTFILSFLIGAIGMYVAVRTFFGNRAGFVAAVIYSYIPYRAVDIYVRGNIAEFFAFSFFPWILWANIKLLNSERKLFWSLNLGLFIGILAISHNISLFIYGQFLLLFNLFWLFFVKRDQFFQLAKYLVISGLLGLGLSCFFWLPLLMESKYVLVGEFKDYPYYLHFLSFSQIWDTPWGYGGFTEKSPMSLQFGKIALVLSFVTLVFNFIFKSQFRNVIYFFAFVLILFTLLETRITEGFWKAFSSVLSFMQFPWRYHILTTFAASVLGGALVYLVDQKVKKRFLVWSIVFGICVLVIYENIGYFKPKEYTNQASVSETTTWNDEYLPRWVKTKPKDYAPDKIIFLNGVGKFSEIDWGYLDKGFTVEATSSGQVQIAHIYYPGWQVRVNNEKKEVSYTQDTGLMQVSIPEGRSRVLFTFERTSWRLVSEVVSAFTLFIMVFLYIRGRYKFENKK